MVAIGGGTGLAQSLRAIRRYAHDVTAIVSVADDGGSSGRLRKDLGMPAPGDLRKCLVALADPGSVWAEAFEHRFEAGELGGHAFGNLVLAGLYAATGDFLATLEEVHRLLGGTGRVLPATREPVVLEAEAGGVQVEGQVAVARAGRISAVSVVPADARPPEEALTAIAAAGQIVIGPGSLFTSVLAAAVVPSIRQALAATAATKVYVCNLREQPPETAGFSVADHVASLLAHGIDIDVVLCDPGSLPLGEPDVRVVQAPLATDDGQTHDPARLAAALVDLVG